MPDAQEIYETTISRLPSEDRLRLALLILNDLTAARPQQVRPSITELIKSFPMGRGFDTSAEVNEFLRRERESWEPSS